MADIKTLRTNLGLTQAVMADLLDINRAQLAMTEAGKRSLPRKAEAKLTDLNEMHLNSGAKKNSSPPDQYRAVQIEEYRNTISALIKLGEDYMYRVEGLRRKLQPLVEQRHNANLALLLSTQNKGDLNKNELSTMAFGIVERDAKKTLKKINAFQIEKLELQIAALEFCLEKIDERMKVYEEHMESNKV